MNVRSSVDYGGGYGEDPYSRRQSSAAGRNSLTPGSQPGSRPPSRHGSNMSCSRIRPYVVFFVLLVSSIAKVNDLLQNDKPVEAKPSRPRGLVLIQPPSMPLAPHGSGALADQRPEARVLHSAGQTKGSHASYCVLIMSDLGLFINILSLKLLVKLLVVALSNIIHLKEPPSEYCVRSQNFSFEESRSCKPASRVVSL